MNQGTINLLKRITELEAENEKLKQRIIDHATDCTFSEIAYEDRIAELEQYKTVLDSCRALAAKQAMDVGLWFVAETAPEGYLQQELRRLHTAIEEGAKE